MSIEQNKIIIRYYLEDALEAVRQAQTLCKQNRKQGLAALNKLFRQGMLPEIALNGRYHGQLVALDIAPGLTPLFEALTRRWLPWQGKAFNASETTGNNIFTRDVLPLSYLMMPFYRIRIPDTPQTFRSFNFRTYSGPGKQDPDRQVLKLDYNLPENPRLNVRRVIDELVQLGDGYYLGKAHLKTWWGSWQMVAYFSLQAASSK